MNKNLSPRRVKSDVTYTIQLKLHEQGTKGRIELIVRSYGCNKNLDDELKNQEEKISSAIAMRL